jgi:5-methyltetrahydropteroyltriglutamate--homocysteine methyltransferase
MFATFAGGYSRRPLPAQPDVLGMAEEDLAAGRIAADGYRATADAYVREILDEMAVVELGIVGEGGVRARDRALPLIDGLGGLAAGEPTVLPDGEPVTRPVVDGSVRWEAPITVRDWQFADGATELLVKQTLIGPYTLAALAEPPGARRTALAAQFGEALNAEIHALAAAGCPLVEVDEPLALRIGDDAREWRAFHDGHRRLTAGFDDPTKPHLSLGLWGGEIHAAGFGLLIDLPYQSFLVDALTGPQNWRFIDAVPSTRGIVVGAADAGTEQLDETEVLVWAMAWAAQGERGSARVGVAPNGSLVSVGRHFAHRKCQRLGEAVRIGSMGPLQEVAEALDEQPTHSKMPALRALAASVNEARAT